MEQVHVGRQSRQGRIDAEVGTAAQPALSTSTARHAAVSRPWHGSLLTATAAMATVHLGHLGHKAISVNGTRRLKEAPT